MPNTNINENPTLAEVLAAVRESQAREGQLWGQVRNILGGLVLAGVCALVVMYAQVQRLDSQVSSLEQRVSNARLDAINANLINLDKRLGELQRDVRELKGGGGK